MGLRRLPYRSAAHLLSSIPLAHEDPGTRDLIKRLRHVRMDRTIRRIDFLEMCLWKSPRSIHHCRRNASPTIKNTFARVFSTPDEETKMTLLLGLHGVGIPTASAILMLADPRMYGVIDIRVWQLLHRLREVRTRPKGLQFAMKDWITYLTILRRHAGILRSSARRVELTLFQTHAAFQQGTLYNRTRPGPKPASRIRSQRGQRSSI